MDQQRGVLIWFINLPRWAKVNDYTDPQLHGKDPLVYLLWLASTLLLATVVLKQYADLVCGCDSRSRCTINALRFTAIRTLLTSQIKGAELSAPEQAVLKISVTQGLHWDVTFHMLASLARVAWSGCAVAHPGFTFCWEIENISLNESYREKRFYFAPRSNTHCALLVNKQVFRRRGPAATWKGSGGSSGFDFRVSYWMCKKRVWGHVWEILEGSDVTLFIYLFHNNGVMQVLGMTVGAFPITLYVWTENAPNGGTGNKRKNPFIRQKKGFSTWVRWHFRWFKKGSIRKKAMAKSFLHLQLTVTWHGALCVCVWRGAEGRKLRYL